MRVQVPAAAKFAAVPETVQMDGVEDERVTGRPEEALAESGMGAPTVWAPGLVKVMVCEGSAVEAATLKLCVTGAAAV